MNDINIAQVLLRKRKEKGVTQEELAHYIGVSKASVSKWETGTSYPDIAFLPQLATYFDISIDELMDYDPQLSKEAIRALCKRLTKTVTERPFEETLAECRALAKKYYACYPLLMQIALFLLNNAGLLEDLEQRANLFREVIALLTRVEEEGHDIIQEELAVKVRAYTYLALNEPDSALVLLEGLLEKTQMPAELLIAMAYQMKGDAEGAKRIAQIGHFQNLVVHINYLTNYLLFVTDDPRAFEATIERALAVSKAYDLPRLHPFLQLGLEYTCAVGYAARKEQEKCLDMLEVFTKRLLSNDVPLDLHGDAYFYLIDSWLAELDAGAELPRNVSLAKEDLVLSVSQNPVFSELADDSRYKRIVARLNESLA